MRRYHIAIALSIQISLDLVYSTGGAGNIITLLAKYAAYRDSFLVARMQPVPALNNSFGQKSAHAL
jgi:hypothetical protein